MKREIREKRLDKENLSRMLDAKEPVQRPKEGEEKKKKSGGVIILEWVRVILIAVAIALLINFFVIVNSVVPTGSMEDTIMPGARMIGLRLSYIFNDPQRGDIIIFKNPDDTSENYVKRIIGLPGDTVEVISGQTYVNGEEIPEPYLKEEVLDQDFGPYEVPEKSYFVMGDNRNNSKDSRYWSTTNYVPRNYILGKALLVYFPFDEFGAIK